MSGRPPTRQLTWDFVLRTFARLRMMTRLDQKSLATALVDDPVKARQSDIHRLSDWLRDLHAYMAELGYDSNVAGRKNDNCAVCGEEILRDHNGAIYCSQKCRQRAYRERKAAVAGRNSPIPKRRRLKRPARIKKRSVSGYEDTSSAAENETTVTPAEAEGEP
jgi:hypothetical protein